MLASAHTHFCRFAGLQNFLTNMMFACFTVCVCLCVHMYVSVVFHVITR